MNQAPTLGKMRKGIDSHFHENDIWGNGNDREDKTGLMNRTPCILIVTYYLIIKYANMILEEFVVG